MNIQIYSHMYSYHSIQLYSNTFHIGLIHTEEKEGVNTTTRWIPIHVKIKEDMFDKTTTKCCYSQDFQHLSTVRVNTILPLSKIRLDIIQILKKIQWSSTSFQFLMGNCPVGTSQESRRVLPLDCDEIWILQRRKGDKRRKKGRRGKLKVGLPIER